MSLDVYLRVPGECHAPLGARIYVRRDGQTVEVTRDEWDEMYPGREPVAVIADDLDDGYSYVYDANITHNMGRMAGECGRLYEALWRPDEQGWTHARDLIEPLRDGTRSSRPTTTGSRSSTRRTGGATTTCSCGSQRATWPRANAGPTRK